MALLSLRTLIVVALLAVGAYYYTQWKAGGKVTEALLKTDLSGKTVLITGANTGIGLDTAVILARMGAKIIVGSRSDERALAAVKKIKQQSGNNNVDYPVSLDLTSFKSVRNFVDVLNKKNEQIHILINNAGIMMSPHGVTEDGYELQFGKYNHTKAI
jgi:NAD(P)-dependent dehydrogenase (short-subunit alcohol dehydrogenase family)